MWLRSRARGTGGDVHWLCRLGRLRGRGRRGGVEQVGAEFVGLQTRDARYLRHHGCRNAAVTPAPVADDALRLAQRAGEGGLAASRGDGCLKPYDARAVIAHGAKVHHECTNWQEISCTDRDAPSVHPRSMEQLILSQSDHVRAVGDRLRRIIRALGIRQVEAAADMGIPKNHLGNWLRGDAYPRQYQLYRFCRIRGITADYILLGDPSGLPHRMVEALIRQELAPAEGAEGDRRAGESSAAS
jgi:transcriptional regulator with XRE-family HTH domain